jgi:hypothetical protein
MENENAQKPLENPIILNNPVSEPQVSTHPHLYPYKKFPVFKIFLILCVLLMILLSIFLLPLPYYQSENLVCPPANHAECPRRGINFSDPLWKKLISKNTNVTIITLPSPIISPSQTPLPDSDWLTYKSSKFPISLKYPPEFKAESVLLPEGNEEVKFNNSKINQELFKFTVSVKPGLQPDLTKIDKSTTVSGILWFYEELDNLNNNLANQMPEVAISTVHNGFIYKINFLGLRNFNHESIQKIINYLIFTDITTISPTPVVPKITFKDQYTGFSISYPQNWQFYQTQDPKKVKVDQAVIISGIELVLGTLEDVKANIVIQIIDSKGSDDLKSWLIDHKNLVPTKSASENIDFKGLPALNYKYQDFPDRQNEAIFFIKGQYIYKIIYMEKGEITDAVRSIISDFTP